MPFKSREEVDESWENIPHEDSAIAETSQLKVQVGDGVGYSSTQPCGENPPLSDTCTFSTPAPKSTKGGAKAKSRLSGLPSALTPILKYLNIGNKCQTPGFIKPGNTNSKPNSDSSISLSGQSLSNMNAAVRLLEDEYLPEVTLLDVTCDTPVQVTRKDLVSPNSVPATAATTQPVCPSFTTLQPSLNTSSRCNTSHLSTITMDGPPESTFAPLRWLDDRFFPEITLLEVTQELSPGMEKFSVNVTQDISPRDAPNISMASSEISGQPAADPNTMDKIQTGDLSTTLEDNATHSSSCSEQSNCVGPNMTKASLELTQDISMSSLSYNSQSSLEPSGLNMGNNSKDTLVNHPVNVTRDMNSSFDTSAESAKFPTSNMQCDTSLKTITSDVLTEAVVISKTEGSLTSYNSKCSSPSPKTARPLKDSFTVANKLSSSSNLSNTLQTPHYVTLDLAPSTVNTPKAESGATDRTVSLSGNTTKCSLEMNSSAVKAGGLCDATFCLQNTFDTRPPRQQNGTITLSETSSSDSHHKTVDLTSSSKVCDATRSPQQTTSDVHPSEVSKSDGLASITDPHAKKADNLESTVDAHPAGEKASETGRSMTRDSAGLPQDTSVIQRRDLESYKACSFNLDDTLDLAAESLVTSTPMPNCKMFGSNTERETDKIFGATKKLYGDAPCKPGGQVTSEIASNIICDRKTFLTKTSTKSLLPSSKPASHLQKYKPASTFPAKFEQPTSGLPMTRRRMQAEALRSTVASDVPQVPTGTSGSYNLRTTAAGSKQPSTGLRKPQSGLPSNIQRATICLRPLSARSNAAAPSSSSDRLRAPTANPLKKISQAKKHPLNQAEALQGAKKRKTDAPLPSSNPEASTTTSCDAANKAKNLKQHTACKKALPAQKEVAQANTSETSTSCDAVSRARVLKQPATSHRALIAKPQAGGCASCVALEQQLKMISEENRRLKEELEKFCREEKC